jgi:hypothetical protein
VTSFETTAAPAEKNFGTVKGMTMSHSQSTRTTLAAAPEVSSRSAIVSETAATAAPANAPATSTAPAATPSRPLDAVMLAIRADAARGAAEYLRATEVPYGGE